MVGLGLCVLGREELKDAESVKRKDGGFIGKDVDIRGPQGSN